MTTTYTDLIARLEKASGPSRELDALIAVATFHEPHGDDDLIYAKPVTKDDNCTPSPCSMEGGMGDKQIKEPTQLVRASWKS